MKRSRADFAVLAVATALGAGIRFATLGHQSYWFDEAVTAEIVGRSFPGMLHAVARMESTPPLYYALAWCWTRVFGSGDIALRALSASIGTATIPATYAAARILTSRRPAAVASVLVAVSPILIWYSQEARAYALLVLLGTLTFGLFGSALASGSARTVGWWAVAAAASLATHYFAVFFVAPEAVWLLVRVRRGATAAAAAAVAAVAAPLAPLAVHQEQSGRTAWIHALPLRERVSETADQFVAGRYPLAHATAIAAALAIGTIAAFRRLPALDRPGALLSLELATVTLALPLLLAGASRVTAGRGDYFLDRNVIWAWVPLAVVAGAVIAAPRARAIAPLGTAALAMLLLAPTLQIDRRSNLQRADWRGVGRALGPPQADRAIVVSPGYEEITLDHYRPVTPLESGRRQVAKVVLVVPGRGRSLPGFVAPAGFAVAGTKTVQDFTLVTLDGPNTGGVDERSLFPSGAPGTTVTALVDRTR